MCACICKIGKTIVQTKDNLITKICLRFFSVQRLPVIHKEFFGIVNKEALLLLREFIERTITIFKSHS